MSERKRSGKKPKAGNSKNAVNESGVASIDPFAVSDMELLAALISRHESRDGIIIHLVNSLALAPALSKDILLSPQERLALDNWLWAHKIEAPTHDDKDRLF